MNEAIVSFLTLGCRLNQAEEESLRRQFTEAGFWISEPKDAAICIVNTCSVTAIADRKSRQQIRHLKALNPNLKIVVTGCGAETAKDLEEVDLVIQNSDKTNTPTIINKWLSGKYKVASSKLDTSRLIPTINRTRTRALLKIQDGCNNFCAYCIVPFLRGREVSVPANEVLNEAIKLRSMGYQELVLSGVNVGKYEDIYQKSKSKKSKIDLTELIKLILKETDFPRIRLSSINPQDITKEMLELWAQEPRLCRHFHLSLQSGSDAILKLMGRPYRTKGYLELSTKIIQLMPEAAITTDIIVGFPGEGEKEFAETVEFVKKANLAKIHVFPYSERAGTRAVKMPGSVPKEVRRQRANELRGISKKLEESFKKRFIGTEMEVLFEEEKDGEWFGLTSNYIRVGYKSADDLSNAIKKIRTKSENLV